MKRYPLLFVYFCWIGIIGAVLAAKDAIGDDASEVSLKAGPVLAESNKWHDRIQISGLVKVEAGISKTDYEDFDVEDENENDVDLATVELAVDAKIAEHVEAHVLFLYEGDDITVDEGFIKLTGTERFPAYLNAGRQYIPFGNFDSHFITDPVTLVLGETNEGALVAGYRFGGDMVDVSIGVFNSDVQETGEDDIVNSFVAGITVNPLEGLTLGASYTSNLASSDTFQEFVVDPETLESLVAGFGVFISFEFLKRFKLIGEYIRALDDFHPGEIYDASDSIARSPQAWNIELGVKMTDELELAVRYGGSDDGGADFLTKSEYGAVLNWGLFENANLALEYLHGKYADDFKTTDSMTFQLAVEF